jgi:hypothetical protein
MLASILLSFTFCGDTGYEIMIRGIAFHDYCGIDIWDMDVHASVITTAQ